ncbi:MAG: hypothetical protein E7482_07440 [Ruminococcaceae bacterium]|nr:hypothetical protein [Oscillospiraceae bacterium]
MILYPEESTIDFSKMEYIPECKDDFPVVCYGYDLHSRMEPWHWHDEFEADIIESGTAVLKLEGEEYHLIYSEVLQDVPEYRPIGLTEEEQIFYDLCSYTVFDYAKTNEYSKINDIEGYFSADGTKLYLEVVFRAPWSKYFEINVNDPTDYSVSDEPFDVKGLGNALSDYYYIIEEFDNKL